VVSLFSVSQSVSQLVRLGFEPLLGLNGYMFALLDLFFSVVGPPP
jgi:hypothetical protein